MKKVLSIILVLVMLVSSMSNILVFASDVSTSLETGDKVVLYAFLSDNPGVTELVLSFEYDSSAMNLVKVTNREAMSDATYTGPKNLASGCMATWYYIDEPDYFKDGSLVALEFEVVDVEAMGDTYPLSVVIVSAEGANGTVFDLKNNIRVIDYRPGDVNGDGIHSLRYDVSEFNQYIVDGCKYDPLGYAVQINENAADVNNDGVITIKDVIDVNKYIVDGGVYDPNGYAVKLYPHTEICKHTSLTAVPAKEETCTEDGNIEYWYCSDCGKYFEDEAAASEIIPEEVVVKATGHTYSEMWSSDEEYHWCAATCGCDEKKEVGVHIFDANRKCSVCNYKAGIPMLEVPTDLRIEYDTISWSAVKNASYILISSGEYFYRMPGTATECEISDLSWTDDDGVKKVITKAGNITVTVQALGDGENYLNSNTATSNEYFYVPQTQNDAKYNSMDDWAIGNGYNLITNENLDTTKAKSPVFNRGKLLTLYNYNENGYTASGDSSSTYTTFSSLDELMLHLSVGSEKSVGFGITDLIGLNLSKSLAGSISFTGKKYNIVEIFEGRLHTKDFRLQRKDSYSNAGLKNCVSDEFLKMVNGELNDYGPLDNYNYDALALDIYNKYGTHAILGVSVGGKYDATITYGTDSMKLAGEYKNGSSAGGNGSYKGITAMFGLGLDFNIDGTYNTEDVEAKMTTTFSGGIEGLIAGKDELQNALDNWQASVAGNETSLFFSDTENSVVSIYDLLLDLQPDGNLANAYKALIETKATDSYDELYNSLLDNYPSRNDRLLKAPENNVLTIDLSPYQKTGSLENAYDPNLIDGILTVYPVMFNKSIDRIVIKGNFDDAASKKLIDGFTVQLSNNWNDNDVDVIVENLGAQCASEYGIVDDKTKISNNTTAVITYSGVNAIRETDGTCYYYYTATGSDEEYAFAFDVESGETLDFSTSKFNSEGIYLPTANKRFYSFTDWYVLKGGTATPISESDGKLTMSYDELASLSGSQSGEPIYLYASWIETPYTITLNNQSADIEAGTESIYSMGDGVYKDTDKTPLDTNIENKPCITVPKKNGYTFKGYYPGTSVDALDKTNCVIDANGVVDLENSIFADFKEGDDYAITLYAYWEPNVYTITLECKNEANRYIYLKYGVGFYTDAECEKDPITSDEKIDIPEKTGYVCTGYYDPNGNLFVESNGSVTAINELNFKVISKDITVTADFDPIEYYVVYYANTPSGASSAVNGVPEKETWTYDEANELAEGPTLKGWTFAGWYKDSACTETNKAGTGGQIIETNFKEDGGETQKLYSKWTANNYTVKYYPNGGTGTTSDSTHTYDKSSSLSVNSFTPPAGYSFGGWKVDPNGTARDYDGAEEVLNLTDENNDTINLYAHWTVNKTAVTLNPNGGTVNGKTSERIEIEYNSTYGDLPEPKRDGYKFLGWYDKSGNKILATTSMTLTEAHTLTAEWEPKKYTVVFDANEGNIKSGAVTTAEFTYEGEKNMTISGAAYTKTGYSFGGWCLTADGTGESVAAETIVSETWLSEYPENGITVYAKWNPKTVTVMLVAGDCTDTKQPAMKFASGSAPFESQTLAGDIVYGTKKNSKIPNITNISTETKYYTFAGWYDKDDNLYIDASGYLKSDWDLIDENSSATLYAKWEKKYNGIDYSNYTYISTASEFSNIRSSLSGKYLLVKSFSIGAISPLGNFSGVLDGGNNTISGWSDVQDNVGNFGLITVNSGTVKNLKLSSFKITNSDPDVSGTLKVGLLCGENKSVLSNIEILSGSSIDVNVASKETDKQSYVYIGMLCGYNTGTIETCSIYGSTSVDEIKAYVGSKYQDAKCAAGGIVGDSSSGTINNCKVQDCNINIDATAVTHWTIWHNSHGRPYAYAGGIVGHSLGGTITNVTVTNCTIFAKLNRNCTCTGDGANSGCYTGGIAGYSTLTLNSSNGTVTGGSRTSKHYDDGNEKNCNCYTGTYRGNS